MENYSNFNSGYDNRINLKRYLLLVGLLFVGIGIIYVLATFTIVKISVSSKTSKGIILSSRTLTDSSEVSSKLIGGLVANQEKTMLVRRGSYEYTVKTDTENATKSVKLGALKINSFTINLIPQRSVTKIGSDSLGCSVSVDSVIYSYGCFKQSNVFRHTPLSTSNFSQKVPLFGEDYKQKVSRPYKTGLLISSEEGIDDSYGALISYQNLKTGNRIPITLPSEYLKGIDEGQDVVHDIVCDTNIENSRFGLVLYDNSILIYDSVIDKEPTQITPVIEDTGVERESLVRSYQIAGDNLVAYAGRSDTPVDSGEEAKIDQGYKQGYVFTYSLASKSAEPKNTIVLPKSLRSSETKILNNTSLVLQTQTGVRVIEIKDNQKIGKELLRAPANATMLVNKNSQLLYANDNKIYSFRPNEAQSNLVFESPLIQFSSFNSGEIISFNAYTKNNQSSQQMQVYALDLNRIASYPRLESVLPYQQNYLPIIQMDYNGKLIVIKPALESLEFIGLPKPTYDQAEYQKKTKLIQDQLAKDGITADKYNIVFII